MYFVLVSNNESTPQQFAIGSGIYNIAYFLYKKYKTLYTVYKVRMKSLGILEMIIDIIVNLPAKRYAFMELKLQPCRLKITLLFFKHLKIVFCKISLISRLTLRGSKNNIKNNITFSFVLYSMIVTHFLFDVSFSSNHHQLHFLNAKIY